MPIYEYMCMKCDKAFEYLVIGGDSSVTCPACNGDKVRRQMSACSHKSSGSYSASSGSSGCGSCSGGSCSTCH